MLTEEQCDIICNKIWLEDYPDTPSYERALIRAAYAAGQAAASVPEPTTGFHLTMSEGLSRFTHHGPLTTSKFDDVFSLLYAAPAVAQEAAQDQPPSFAEQVRDTLGGLNMAAKALGLDQSGEVAKPAMLDEVRPTSVTSPDQTGKK